MRIVLQVKSECDAVYLVNGTFIERISKMVVQSDEVVYVTVLPLSPALLPYTAKICGGSVVSPKELCRVFDSPQGKTVSFLPHYNYVYPSAPKTETDTNETDVRKKFFLAVKSGKLLDARALMTDELSSAVDDETLASFFDDYSSLYVNESECTATDKNGKTKTLVFTLNGEKIDDVEER